MFYLKNKVLLSLLLSIGIFSNSSFAVEKQILEIKAQYLLLNEKNGVSEYKGDVLLSKDTLIIKADSVTLYYKNKELNKALIIGSPADVQHQPDNEEKVHSQANKMEFFVKDDRLVLKGDAFVNQGNRHFSGEYIEYDTRQRIITAAGEKNKLRNAENAKNIPQKSRVHVIIGPTDEIEDSAKNSEKNKDKI